MLAFDVYLQAGRVYLTHMSCGLRTSKNHLQPRMQVSRIPVFRAAANAARSKRGRRESQH